MLLQVPYRAEHIKEQHGPVVFKYFQIGQLGVTGVWGSKVVQHSTGELSLAGHHVIFPSHWETLIYVNLRGAVSDCLTFKYVYL